MVLFIKKAHSSYIGKSIFEFTKAFHQFSKLSYTAYWICCRSRSATIKHHLGIYKFSLAFENGAFHKKSTFELYKKAYSNSLKLSIVFQSFNILRIGYVVEVGSE